MNSVVAILCVCDACAFVIYMNAYLRVNDMHFNSCLYFSSYFYLYIFFRCVTSNQKQHKKNAKYKNQHRSNTTTISDSEFNSHEDDDEETQATNINEMFDYALALLWPLVTKNKWDMTSLPDITEGFSYVSCIPSFRHSVIFCCIFFVCFISLLYLLLFAAAAATAAVQLRATVMRSGISHGTNCSLLVCSRSRIAFSSFPYLYNT